MDHYLAVKLLNVEEIFIKVFEGGQQIIGAGAYGFVFFIDSYSEEEVNNEKRVVLRLHPKIAPYKVAVFPLLNKDGLPEKALEVYEILKKEFHCFYDSKGSIGRRYRRMDEIGTPFCVTIDHETLEDDTVTIRDRDTMKQIRVKIENLVENLRKLINFEMRI